MDKNNRCVSPSLEAEEVPEWPDMYPHLLEARRKAIEVIQEAGEVIFVPSGWHHSVENLDDTISINHNWFNGFNIAWSVQILCETFIRSVELVVDCRCVRY
jgi:hypothetical protein